MKNSGIITLILILVVGGGAFFAGIQYQKMQRAQGFAQFAAQNGQRRFPGQNSNARPVAGEIISTDDKSITIKMQDGSSKIVLFSGSTAIMESTTAGKEKLVKGKQVIVFGSSNADGSVTAQNISLNPQLRQGNRK